MYYVLEHMEIIVMYEKFKYWINSNLPAWNDRVLLIFRVHAIALMAPASLNPSRFPLTCWPSLSAISSRAKLVREAMFGQNRSSSKLRPLNSPTQNLSSK